ncbi:MAG TPA: hypothetical protein VNM87_06610 [Candidatus Udaeobacter sp.]|nr:hypothetical protein [Candidatus Udaeobacter sp.]
MTAHCPRRRWLLPLGVVLLVSLGAGCKSGAPNAKPETEVKAPAATTPRPAATSTAPATPAPAAADATAPPPATPEARATGYDLYSWKGGNWYFALLPGMNRLRSTEEVKAPATTIDGLSALKSKLKQLERGTKVNWSANVPGTELPTIEIVSELSTYGAQHGIELSVKQ